LVLASLGEKRDKNRYVSFLLRFREGLEKTILTKTLQSRATYKNRPLRELEEIVSQHPTIEDLIDFVIQDEGQR